MKTYIVRLTNCNGFVFDGEIYEAPNEQIAKEMYAKRCESLGIEVGQFDCITVETM